MTDHTAAAGQSSSSLLPSSRNGVSVQGWSCVKRNGSSVPFDESKIRSALDRCLSRFGAWSDGTARAGVVDRLTRSVVHCLFAEKNTSPDVETVQRFVIRQLWAEGLFDEAEHYQNYREQRRKARENSRIDPAVVELVNRDAAHFPTPLQAYQFYSKFARWRESDCRRETWSECNARVFTWFATLPQFHSLTREEVEWLKDSMFHFRSSPAMRVVQMAGPALERCHIGVYNCSYTPISDLFSFAELLYILMQGSGVGFSVESEYISHLPVVKKKDPSERVVWKFTVPDSTEGWCDALHFGLQKWFDGDDVEYDLSLIRPRNTPLRTKGGSASGPGPIRDLLAFVRKTVRGAVGRRLTDLEVHDICCMTGKIVQVGGVRRASCISISDLSSVPMRTCKHGSWWMTAPYRSMANNSGCYEERPDPVTFLSEFLALIESRSGERGIFNRGAMLRQCPKRRKKVRFGGNPCLEIVMRPRGLCVSGDTPLITRGGIVRIGEVVGQEVEVWNGKRWSRVVPRQTGSDRDLVRVSFSDGSHLDCTSNHRFSVNTATSRYRLGGDCWREVEAKDLKSRMATETFVIQHDGGDSYEDAYTLGVLLGDGTINSRVGDEWVTVDLYGPKMHLPVSGRRGKTALRPGYNVEKVRVNCGSHHVDLLKKLRSDDEVTWFGLAAWDRESILRFLAGWFDTDGSDTGSGGVRLYVSGRFRADVVQLLLTKCGIRSSVNLMSLAGEVTNYGRRSADVWYVQVTDCDNLPCCRLDVSRGHDAIGEGKYQTVVSVECLPGRHDTFCFEEMEEHKGVFNNTLTYQCNLSMAILRGDETVAEMEDRVRAATYFGVLQSCATKFNYVRPEWKQNAEEERLLGVDIMGHLDHPLLRPGASDRDKLVIRLKQIVAETSVALSTRFGINVSAANTCLKPGGDSAVFFNSSNLSPRFSPYQIRRTREAADSPVCRLLKDAGVPWEPAAEDEAGLVAFSWPKANPPGCITRDDMTAIAQLENWLFWKKHWAEHSCSVTIYVKEDEWLDVAAWVYKEEHWNHLTGVSFLPWDNGSYRTAPNEAVSEEQYREMLAKFPTIDWSRLVLYEEEDRTVSAQTPACVGGACEI